MEHAITIGDVLMVLTVLFLLGIASVIFCVVGVNGGWLR